MRANFTRRLVFTISVLALTLGTVTLVLWPISKWHTRGVYHMILETTSTSGEDRPIKATLWSAEQGPGYILLQHQITRTPNWPDNEPAVLVLMNKRVKVIENIGPWWFSNAPYDSKWFDDGTTYIMVRNWLAASLLIIPSLIYLILAWRRRLRQRLRLQTNLCLHCGYNLTGVESDKCPECGAARPMVTVSSAG